MKKSIAGFFPVILFISLAGLACGDDDATNPVSITPETLQGTYELIAFTVTFEDGTEFTQDDFSSFSGTMVITSNGNMSQMLEVEGTTATITATFEVINDNTLQLTAGSCTYNLEIQLSNNTLTTTFALGTCGSNFSEIDVWQKTSEQTSTPQSRAVTQNTTPGAIAGKTLPTKSHLSVHSSVPE